MKEEDGRMKEEGGRMKEEGGRMKEERQGLERLSVSAVVTAPPGRGEHYVYPAPRGMPCSVRCSDGTMCRAPPASGLFRCSRPR